MIERSGVQRVLPVELEVARAAEQSWLDWEIRLWIGFELKKAVDFKEYKAQAEWGRAIVFLSISKSGTGILAIIPCSLSRTF